MADQNPATEDFKFGLDDKGKLTVQISRALLTDAKRAAHLQAKFNEVLDKYPDDEVCTLKLIP